MQVNDTKLQLDFRWTAEPLSSEPVTGMSESLAEGLVSRFIDEWTRSDLEALDRHPPPLKQKRAAAYRAICAWLHRSVPPSLQIMTIRQGAQTGKEKAGAMALVHWQPEPSRKSLLVAVQTVSAHRPDVVSQMLVTVSRHALVRLFQRLKTDDPLVVLGELAQSMKSYWHFSLAHVDVFGRADIMVPTPRGAAAIGADDLTRSGTVVKTWISDERMAERPTRLRAVQQARAEDGYVLMANGRFVVLSNESLNRRGTQEAILDCIRVQLEKESADVWDARNS